VREAELARILEALGAGVVDSLLKPNDDMWIRVTAETWRVTAEKLKALGYTYFGYVSAIDWLPSPFGKSEDDASGPSGERDSTIKLMVQRFRRSELARARSSRNVWYRL